LAAEGATFLDRHPPRFSTAVHTRAVRIEISPEQLLLFTHDDFAFSELKREGNEQVLRLVFAMQEVLVRG